MSRRITILFLLLSFMWLALIVRGIHLQITPDERIASLYEKQSKTVLNIEGRRGFIFDRTGNELAASVTAYSLYVDPKMVDNPKILAKKMAKLIKEPYGKILNKIKKTNRRFVWLQRRMSLKEKEIIASYNFRGVGFIEEPKRVYPNGELMSSVLGFVGSQGQGLGGLEVKFEDNLSGSDKSLKVQRDARGRPLFINGVLFNENPDGYNLHLSVDRELQHRLERELNSAIDSYSAKGAWGIVLDVRDSQILAMASLPSFDPNHALSSPMEQRRNRSVTDPFEPGSTMKVMTIASALKQGIAKPKSKYYCEEGILKIGKRIIREADTKHKFKWLSVEDILMHSSNIGTSKISFELGDQNLRNDLLDFGFGSKISVDFPAESRGIIPKLPWAKHLLSNISFGHGVAVTPLQLVNAYAAIANGGTLYEPYLVTRISDSQDRTVYKNSGRELRRILSPQVSQEMLAMMGRVVSPEGTGNNAQVEYYNVGGKTGTAQKIDLEKGGYEKGAYISSFVGVLPLENPRYAILVAIDQPESAYYASEVAAPVFARLASFTAFHYGLQPSKPVPIKQKRGLAQNQKTKKSLSRLKNQEKAISEIQRKLDWKKWEIMPDLKGLSLRESLDRLREQSLEVKVYGTGVLSYSIPDQGQNIPEGTKVKLYFK